LAESDIMMARAFEMRSVARGIALLMLFTLSACAGGGRPLAMTAPPDPTHAVDANSPLFMGSRVSVVEGGMQTSIAFFIKFLTAVSPQAS
jgi:hypothetical protein